MTRHKRRKQLLSISRANFREAAERFHKEMLPMFRDLVPTTDGYRALLAISDAISTAYKALDVEPPERLCGRPLRTMEGHRAFRD